MATEMRHLMDGEKSGELLGSLVIRALADNGGRWDIASLRRPGFRAMENAMIDPTFRALAPLPEKAQVVLDNAVIKVGLDRLSVVKTIMGAGLTYNLADPLSVTQLEWYAQSKVANATRSMSPESRDENYLPDLLQSRLPIYLTKAAFNLDIRTLRMSQRVGMPLDTVNIENGTRAVNESIEDAMINGATTLDGLDLAVAGYKAPGLLNAPNALTSTLTAASWDMTPVAADIYTQVASALQMLRANKRFGPYAMFVPTGIAGVLDADYVTAAPQNTIRERLLKLEGLNTIVTADLLPGGVQTPASAPTYVGAKVIIVQMTSDVVDIVVGQRPTVIPWTSVSGFTFYNMIMAIMIPRVKSTYDAKTGIWVGTLA
jgi:hypothetical protein